MEKKYNVDPNSLKTKVPCIKRQITGAGTLDQRLKGNREWIDARYTVDQCHEYVPLECSSAQKAKSEFNKIKYYTLEELLDKEYTAMS